MRASLLAHTDPVRSFLAFLALLLPLTGQDLAAILRARPVAPGKFVFLRTDLQVQNSQGMLFPPELGLESTVVANTGLRGELCATKDELGPVVDALRAGGVSVRSISVRYVTDPSLYFVQFTGPQTAASAVRRALDELGRDRMIGEGLQRTGEMPVVDWKGASEALGSPYREIGASRVYRAELPSGVVTVGGCPCGRSVLIARLHLSVDGLDQTLDAARKARLNPTSLRSIESGVELCLEGEGDAIRLSRGLHQVLSTR